jgi:phosphohistidine phosphatase
VTPARVALLRHGEALPSARGGRDFERPLSDRGLLEARGAALAIATVMPQPDLILASSARRTMQTAETARDTAFAGVPVIAEPLLYCATADALLDVLSSLGGGFRAVLLVGHNPGISEACSRLAGGGQVLSLQTAGWRSFETPYLARGSFSPSPG